MNKIFFSVSVVLLSVLYSCSSSKNIGTTSMPDPKPRSAKSDAPKVLVKEDDSNLKSTPSSSTISTQTATTKPSKSANVVVKEERVTVIEEVGTPVEPGKYYIIMGSFKVLENARNLKKQLIIDHFNPLLLQNEDGLYRVAGGTFSQETPARDRIEAIRSQSDKYDDVWLLVQKQ